MTGARAGLGDSRPLALDRCPGCRSRTREPHRRKDDLQLERCDRCTLVYANPQPREQGQQRYVEEYDLASHLASWKPRKDVLFARRATQLPQPAAGRNRLCDVGCADGLFLETVRALGWDVAGVEPNPFAAARARSRSLHVVGSLLEEAEDLAWRSYDVVTCWDVLEHTPNPREFAETLARLLKPEGEIFLSTLNEASLASRVLRTRWSMVHATHFTYWNPTSLRMLFGQFGLEVAALETHGLGRDFVSWLDRVPRRHPDPDANQAPKRWDVNPAVLLAERPVNWMLRQTGWGVELLVRLKAA